MEISAVKNLTIGFQDGYCNVLFDGNVVKCADFYQALEKCKLVKEPLKLYVEASLLPNDDSLLQNELIFGVDRIRSSLRSTQVDLNALLYFLATDKDHYLSELKGKLDSSTTIVNLKQIYLKEAPHLNLPYLPADDKSKLLSFADELAKHYAELCLEKMKEELDACDSIESIAKTYLEIAESSYFSSLPKELKNFYGDQLQAFVDQKLENPSVKLLNKIGEPAPLDTSEGAVSDDRPSHGGAGGIP